MTLAPVTNEHSGKSDKNRLVEAERLLSAYSNGAPVSQLVEEFGLSSPTIYRRLKMALDARIAPTVDEYRAVQNSVLDEQMQRIQQHFAAALEMVTLGELQGNALLIDKGLTHHLRAMEMQQRVLERRARLNGLDAPVKVDAQVVHHDAKDLELAEMVRTAKERARDRAAAGPAGDPS